MLCKGLLPDKLICLGANKEQEVLCNYKCSKRKRIYYLFILRDFVSDALWLE